MIPTKNATANVHKKTYVKRPYEYNWSTSDELRFLRNLGYYTPNRNRQDCLKGYRKAIKRRTAWGAINPAIIKDYLDKHIFE